MHRFCNSFLFSYQSFRTQTDAQKQLAAMKWFCILSNEVFFAQSTHDSLLNMLLPVFEWFFKQFRELSSDGLALTLLHNGILGYAHEFTFMLDPVAFVNYNMRQTIPWNKLKIS